MKWGENILRFLCAMGCHTPSNGRFGLLGMRHVICQFCGCKGVISNDGRFIEVSD